MNLRERVMGKGRKCKAHSSRTGEPCKHYAIHGGTVCQTHGGRSPQVKKAAAKRVADMLAEALDPDRVMREGARVAYSNLQDFYDENGKLLPIREWPEDAARAVKSIETIRGNADKGDGKYDDVVRITLWDKPGRLQDFMKHHGKLIEKVEISGTVDIAERLAAGRKRAKAKA